MKLFVVQTGNTHTFYPTEAVALKVARQVVTEQEKGDEAEVTVGTVDLKPENVANALNGNHPGFDPPTIVLVVRGG